MGLGIRTGLDLRMGPCIRKVLFCSDTETASVIKQRPRYKNRRVALASTLSDKFVQIANREQEVSGLRPQCNVLCNVRSRYYVKCGNLNHNVIYNLHYCIEKRTRLTLLSL